MFEDFSENQNAKESQKRLGASLLLSAIIFSLVMSAVAAAVATARVIVKRRQNDLAVQFEELPKSLRPELKSTKPELKIKKGPVKKRAAAKPRKLESLSEIPDEKPDEAEGELAEADDLAPIDGIVASEQGSGEAQVIERNEVERAIRIRPEAESKQQRATVEGPRFISGCRLPEIPQGLHAQAATIRVEIRLLIGVDGKVESISILNPHPLIPDEVIRKCVRQQVYQPALLPDGTAVPYPFRQRFVFRPTSV
ncbi:MAG: hypothetical protein JXA30_00665 [Deltaproteobacteria bacterium]|nr:hypothetical protein [Deltaproteobacteria bacterium]